MNRQRLAQTLILVAALNVAGCGGAAEKSASDVKAPDTPPVVNAVSPTPAAVAAASASPTPTATAGDPAPLPGTVPASDSRGARSAKPAQMPASRIGSGGNDLYLFTQARAAVDTDPGLKAANLIIEVKDGVVTLNGTVASASLKTKAEELARGVGPKAVRNQLRVSAGQ